MRTPVIALAAALALTGAWIALDLPRTQTDLEQVVRSLEGWAFVVAGVFAFVEVGTPIGLLTPTELAVPLTAALAVSGWGDLPLLIAAVWAFAAAGESVGYLTGRRAGRPLLTSLAARLRDGEARLAVLECHFEHHGVATVLLARFGPLIRTLTPLLAGSSQMPYRHFVVASTIGTGLWSAVLCLLGYMAIGQVERLDRLALLVAAGAVALVALAALVKRWRAWRLPMNA